MSVDTSNLTQLDVEPGTLPETMAAWVIRKEREGEPKDAFQLEQIEVPEPGAFEVIVRVMAAGVNFNNVWASLGKPVSVFGYGDHPEYGHHIGGSDASGIVWKVGEGVTRWKPGDEVVDPLQPGLLRGRRGARARPARRAEPADLGLRDDLGLVRRVHQGAGAAAAAAPPEHELGRGLLLRPHLLHRLPDADRPVQAAARPQRPDLGRGGRPRRLRHPALRGGGRQRGRRRLQRREGRAGQETRRRRLHQPLRIRRDDADRRQPHRPGRSTRSASAPRAASPTGSKRSSATPPTSSSSTSAAPPSRPPSTP